MTSAPYPTYPDIAVPSPPCGDVVYMDIDGIRHVFECHISLPEHTGQPHVVQIPGIEEGDSIGIYWYHAGE